MRIRTVKPEFWAHEKMSALPAEIALLALGLLNYADDEGYFNANARLIQATIFPLRELSITIPVMLQELEKARYIDIRTHKDGKQLGRVINFDRHQVISHSKDSVIRPEFEVSRLSPVELRDSSRKNPSRKEGNREQGNGEERRGRDARGRALLSSGGLPEDHGEPIRSRMLAINALMNRRADTSWSAKELAAFHDAALDDLDDETFADQLGAMSAYYGASVAALQPFYQPKKPNADFRRRDMHTLLFHWGVELDNARKWVHWQEKNLDLCAGMQRL